jgi:hypothetical protein
MEKGIRKQIYDLTPGDLESYPVWEFALDEEGNEAQDEATVRPTELPSNPIDFDGLVVRAQFHLADGTKMIGHMTVDLHSDGSANSMQPSIVTDKDQVMFCHGFFELPNEEVQRLYDQLGKTKTQVFPITFTSDVPNFSPAQQGMIDGFEVMKRGWFRTKTLVIR